MSALRALIFDVDGTLADTEGEGHLPAFNEAFAAAGLDWHWSPALYRELLSVAGGRERLRHYMTHYLPPEQRPEDVAGLATRLHQDKNRRYETLLRAGRIGLRPGVARLLGEAREAGLTLAIATTSVRENVLTLLQCTLGSEAPNWFQVMATADEVTEKKPSPRVYEYTLDALGMAPSQCLVFEDSENGLHAARAAGLETIVAVNAFTRDGRFDDALLVLDHWGEPDRPCRVLGGRRRDRFDAARPWLDLAQLRRLRP